MVTGRQPVKLPFPFIQGLTHVQQEQLYLDFQAMANLGDGTRWATLVIAASDSTAENRAVADYVCDGSGDEVTINQAVTDCATLSDNNGRIVLLEGTYVLAAPVDLSGVASGALEIVGMGRGATTVRTSTASACFSSTSADGRWALRNMTISNTFSGGAGVSALLDNSGSFTAEELDVTGHTLGIDIFGGGNHLVSNCRVRTTTTGAGRGIRLDHGYLSASLVIGNYVIMGGGRGITTNCGGSFGDNTTIVNNYVAGTGEWGIAVNNGAADGNTLSVVIANNYILGTFGHGVELNGSSASQVVSNKISGCGIGICVESIGLTINDTAYIANNLVTGSTGTAGILTGNCGNISVCFNKIVGTGSTYSVSIGGGSSNCAMIYNDVYGANGTNDSGTSTRTEVSSLPSVLDANARIAVRKNSTGTSLGTRRRLNLIEGTDFSISVADDSGSEEVDITLGLAATVDSNARTSVRRNSTGSTYARRRLNFIEGSGITIAVADDSGSEEVDITINQAAGAGSGDVEGQFIVGFDGGGSTLAAGKIQDVQAPFAGTIDSWTIYADQADTVTVEVWKDVYGSYPPTVGDKISASAGPSLTGVDHNTSSSLGTWTSLSVTAGDILRFKLSSVSVATRLLVVLHYTRP